MIIGTVINFSLTRNGKGRRAKPPLPGTIAMFVDQRLREAELAFLNAPFEAEGWRHAIERMAEVTRSAVGQLCGFASGLSLPYNLLSADLHDPTATSTIPTCTGLTTGVWRSLAV
jgi:hypothetical protein